MANISDQLYEELQEVHTRLRDQRKKLVEDAAEAEREFKKAQGRLLLLDQRLDYARQCVDLFKREEEIPEELPL